MSYLIRIHSSKILTIITTTMSREAETQQLSYLHRAEPT